MRVRVLVEGETDAVAFEQLLPPDLCRRVRIDAADGRDSAVSRARTILSYRNEPVLVVVDADVVGRGVAQLREEVEDSLRRVSPGIEFGVVLLEPELEALFFQSPILVELLEGIAGRKVDRGAAVAEPKAELLRLFPDYGPKRLQSLLADSRLLAALRESTIMLEIIKKLESLATHAAAA